MQHWSDARWWMLRKVIRRYLLSYWYFGEWHRLILLELFDVVEALLVSIHFCILDDMAESISWAADYHFRKQMRVLLQSRVRYRRTRIHSYVLEWTKINWTIRLRRLTRCDQFHSPAGRSLALALKISEPRFLDWMYNWIGTMDNSKLGRHGHIYIRPREGSGQWPCLTCATLRQKGYFRRSRDTLPHLHWLYVELPGCIGIYDNN